MNFRIILGVLVVASIGLTSVAAASSVATKQRVAINTNVLDGEFVLLPLRPGALKRDSGSFSGNWRSAPTRKLLRNGQDVMTVTNTWNLEGKRGTLTLRERLEWFGVGSDGNGDGSDDGVAVGTWKIVAASGAYAGTSGSGGSAHAGLGRPWNARFEGFLVGP
jgi:hypothetical protein